MGESRERLTPAYIGNVDRKPSKEYTSCSKSGEPAMTSFSNEPLKGSGRENSYLNTVSEPFLTLMNDKNAKQDWIPVVMSNRPGVDRYKHSYTC